MAILSPGNEKTSVFCQPNSNMSRLKTHRLGCLVIQVSTAASLINKKSLILVTCHIDWKCTINSEVLRWLLMLLKPHLHFWVFNSSRLDWDWEAGGGMWLLQCCSFQGMTIKFFNSLLKGSHFHCFTEYTHSNFFTYKYMVLHAFSIQSQTKAKVSPQY